MQRRNDMGAGRLATGFALLALLAGCQEYLDRRDGLTRHSGDAPHLNAHTHAIDPWPPASRVHYPPMDGERARRAVDRYRTNQTFKPNQQGTTDSIPSGGGGAGG
ncbi:MAG: hypothetical protein GC150_09395 [Rhizobiales bacterium]|nr:hypothetical protein [Hyphomicrobiales bacterium]